MHPLAALFVGLLVAIYEQDVNTIWVVGHTDCGAQHLSAPTMIEKDEKPGYSAETIQLLSTYDPDFDTMLHGIVDVGKSVQETVTFLQEHPLIPHDVTIKGFIVDTTTGKLSPCD